jgi:hypothetical protein
VSTESNLLHSEKPVTKIAILLTLKRGSIITIEEDDSLLPSLPVSKVSLSHSSSHLLMLNCVPIQDCFLKKSLEQRPSVPDTLPGSLLDLC